MLFKNLFILKVSFASIDAAMSSPNIINGYNTKILVKSQSEIIDSKSKAMIEIDESNEIIMMKNNDTNELNNEKKQKILSLKYI